ncbi:MAG: OmpA family protein [Bacteroidia bacterium]|nr:OmpA family protein [Bacteroidia bacterium]
MFKSLISGICLMILTISLHAQEEVTTSSGKAARHYKLATEYYDVRKDIQALEELNVAISADNKFIEAYLLRSDIYHDMQNYSREVADLKKAISINPEFFPSAYYNLGRALLLTGQYEEAKNNYQFFLETGNKPELSKKAKEKIKQCDFAINVMKHPVPFEPKNLGENVNTEWDDYSPSLTADENTIITTVDVPFPDVPKNKISEATSQEDFYISHKVNGEWTKARPFGAPLNTDGNEGAQSISADGQFMIFTACNRKDSYGSCDLYFSAKRGNSWTLPVNMGSPVNTQYWESQPSISSDGKTLYFVSNRPGGKGNMDIWKTILQEDGKWSMPVNLGDSINTPDDEMSPFIHPDNQTFYFASTGWPGMGNFDIFVSRKNAAGEWGTPKNLGYPINTFQDESSLIVNAKGTTAYYSTERPGSRKKDIYTFDLYEQAKPIQTNYVKGKIIDDETGEPLEARLQLIDIDNNVTIAETWSNKTDGEYLVCLPVDKNYSLNISKDDHLFHSENFSLKNLKDPSKPYNIDIRMKPIKVGEKVVLNNIFFKTNMYDLQPESQSELDKLVDFMTKNPGIKVEIGGHTDNVGSDELNQTLSENRAKSVVDYLVAHKISSGRINYKGYGKTMPVATNDTEEGRALNRRTEFKIIDK